MYYSFISSGAQRVFHVLVLGAALLLSTLPIQAASGIQRVLLYDCCDGIYDQAKDSLRATLMRFASDKGFELVMTRTSEVFNAVDLETFDVVVLGYAAWGIASSQGRADFENYVRSGGGVVSVFETSNVQNFPFLRDSVLVLRIGGSQSGLEYAPVFFDTTAHGDHELAKISQGLPDSLTLGLVWAPYIGQSAVSDPRSYLANAGANILLSGNVRPSQMLSNHPLVWTQKIGLGRSAVHMALTIPANVVFTQHDNYTTTLLWNLMEYVAGGGHTSVRPERAGWQPVPQLRLSGRNLMVTLPEGLHILKIWDTRGRSIQTRNLQGPGTFDARLHEKGVLVVRMQGPHGILQKRIFVD